MAAPKAPLLGGASARDVTLEASVFAAELKKPYPNLEDTWLPWIVAVGLGDAAAAWRRRKPPDASVVPDPAAFATMGRWTGGTTPADGGGWVARFLAGPHA